MSTTRLKDLPPRLQDRYGYRRAPIAAIIVGLTLTLILIVFGGWTAYRVANPEVRWKLLAWQAVNADYTSMTFEVTKSPRTSVDCVLRIQDKMRQDLGYAIVTVPPGSEYNQVTYNVATRELGFTAEVLNCATPGNLHAPTPQFPPGTSNPPQPWRPA
jgi:hypothetical protein